MTGERLVSARYLVIATRSGQGLLTEPIVLKKSSNTQWWIDLCNIVVYIRLLAAVYCNEGYLL
jgi:hypothetical protein